MQTFRHITTVHGDRIAEMVSVEGAALLTLDDGSTHKVEQRWVANHNPQVGGYLLQAGPGRYTYWPADRFEATYVALPASD